MCSQGRRDAIWEDGLGPRNEKGLKTQGEKLSRRSGVISARCSRNMLWDKSTKHLQIWKTQHWGWSEWIHPWCACLNSIMRGPSWLGQSRAMAEWSPPIRLSHAGLSAVLLHCCDTIPRHHFELSREMSLSLLHPNKTYLSIYPVLVLCRVIKFQNSPEKLPLTLEQHK